MKIRNVIEYVDELYENVFSETIKLRWLNQLEAELQTEVLLLAAEGITQYTQEDMDAELIAPAPFDKIYEEYLIWRMMTAQGEAERANNQQAILDEAWKAYARFVAETVDPKSGLAQTMRYYLSAYQVAVKHGYTGTETEWVTSLKGDKGEAGAGLNIVGQVETKARLPTLDDSDEGTAYLVGTGVEALLYIWDGSEWFYKQPISVKGEPGKSITVASVSTSTEDGGTNVVTFSDGKTLDVKNGRKGGRGDKGDSVTIARITESGESGGENAVEFSDGNVLKIKNGKDAEGLPGTAADGGYYTPSITQPDKNTMRVSYAPSADGMPSVPDKDITLPAGKNGTPVTVTNVIESTVSGNENVVEFSDGSSLKVRNGKQGTPGTDGGYYKIVLSQSGENGMRVDYTASKSDMPIAPSDYIVLPKGDPGYTPQKGVDYFDGAPGYTPQKGVDYFDGAPGTSVTVASVSESTEDGGANVVTFSDGEAVTIRNGSKGSKGDKGDPASVTAENIQSALGYTPARQDDVAGKVDKTGLSLGLYTDGKYYIFVDGTPVGTGFELSGNSGDVFGYVDENNNVVLTGNLPDGDYTIKYELESGKVIEIGNLVLDNNVYYSVISNLSNCTNSNSATQVVGGQSYSATITANSGYQLSYVTVTMDGQSVSVNGGNISIAEVTGDIVITAVAEEIQTTNYTNILTSGKYTIEQNKRWSNSSKAYTNCNGMICITIPTADVLNKTIYFKGFTKDLQSSGSKALWMAIDASLAKVCSLVGAAGDGNVWGATGLTDEGNGVYSLLVNSTNFTQISSSAYLKLNMAVNASAAVTSLDGLIMTIDEPIV